MAVFTSSKELTSWISKGDVVVFRFEGECLEYKPAWVGNGCCWMELQPKSGSGTGWSNDRIFWLLGMRTMQDREPFARAFTARGVSPGAWPVTFDTQDLTNLVHGVFQRIEAENALEEMADDIGILVGTGRKATWVQP